MRAIMTVTGKDHTGIVASVSVELARLGVNILDISQTIMEEYFTMILMVELNEANNSVKEVKAAMKKVEEEQGLVIRLQAEDTFHAMHRI
ncbi:MAG TPA: ACT domain-containing protein [Trichococcus sp.]|nr:ACT domain-containing protein [Trichococcus sp.]